MPLIVSCPVINTFASKFTIINNNKTLNFHRRKKTINSFRQEKRPAMTREMNKKISTL